MEIKVDYMGILTKGGDITEKNINEYLLVMMLREQLSDADFKKVVDSKEKIEGAYNIKLPLADDANEKNVQYNEKISQIQTAGSILLARSNSENKYNQLQDAFSEYMRITQEIYNEYQEEVKSLMESNQEIIESIKNLILK